MLVMKNQDMNLLDENFQLKDPTQKSDRYVLELGLSHYDKVGTNQKLRTGDMIMTKICEFIALRAPYHYSDPNQRGRGWAFHVKLEREVKNNFQNMKVAESYLKKSCGVRDPHTKQTIRTVIWPPTDKENVIPVAHKFSKGVLKNFQFQAYDPRMAEAAILMKENSIG
ncbi:hypothetical protein Hanom_Chr04g00331011 [Helianthus anomalus]